MNFQICLLLGLLICPHAISKVKQKSKYDSSEIKEKDGKVFSIFSIVQFKNNGCVSETSSSSTAQDYRNGTCFTSAECGTKGGTSSGTCAGGFGVCCVFQTSTCGSSVSQNCSYIKNPNHPSAYTSTSNCQFTIYKCDSSVCDFRLDFDQYLTNAPSATDETTGGICQDSLTITTNTGFSVPVICGLNTGQHMYLDIGRGSSDSATLAFTFSGTFSRYWDIKITQIPCGVAYDAPNGCLQYHTGIDGRFSTFNYGLTGTPSTYSHLRNQNYRICIRQEEGYCCVTYMKCTSGSYQFSLNTAGSATFTLAKQGTDCSEDYVGIEASSHTGCGNLKSVYCGGILNDLTSATIDTLITDCTAPFEVSIVTDATTDATAGTIAGSNRGVCLEYTQIPCNAGNQCAF